MAKNKDLNISISYFVRNNEDLEYMIFIEELPIQLGLKTTDASEIKKIKNVVDKYKIDVSSIHAPKILPEESSIIEELAEIFNTKRFTLHPSKGNFNNATNRWSGVLAQLYDKGIKVGFENLRNSRVWLKNPYDLLKLDQDYFKLTLDIQHLPNYLDEIDAYNDLNKKILMIHLLDRDSKKAAPYKDYTRFLPYIFNNPPEEIVLEYGKDNLDYMIRDYKTIHKLYQEFKQQTDEMIV